MIQSAWLIVKGKLRLNKKNKKHVMMMGGGVSKTPGQSTSGRLISLVNRFCAVAEDLANSDQQ